MDVKFLRGLQANYNAIQTKDQGTFYITGLNENGFDSIYLGSHLLGTTLASGIVLTDYNLGEGKSTSAGIDANDTVLSAIQKLDIALANATGADHAVVSFGGKTGAITLSNDGNVELSMVENALKANIDLSGKQDVLTAGNYINIDDSNNITTVQGTFELNDNNELNKIGLVTNETVKSYVESYVGIVVGDYVTKEQLKSTLSGYVTTNALTETLLNYQPVGDYQPAGDYQEALTPGDYINIDETNTITTVQGSFDEKGDNGLATTLAVKTYVFEQNSAQSIEIKNYITEQNSAQSEAITNYVDQQIETITAVLTWGSF